MSDDSFSTKLRLLSKDYYQKHISFIDYRLARKSILDQIDEEFNGYKIDVSEPEAEEQSMFMKTVAFFANSDLQDKSDK